MGCGWRSQYLAIVHVFSLTPLYLCMFSLSPDIPVPFMPPCPCHSLVSPCTSVSSCPLIPLSPLSPLFPCPPCPLVPLVPLSSLSPCPPCPFLPLVPRPSVHSYPSPFSPCPSVHSSPSPLPPLSPCRPGFSLSCCPPLSPLSPCSPCVPCPSPSPCPLVPLVSLSPWSSSHLVPLSPCSLDNLFLFIPLFSLFSLGALCSALLVFFVIPVDFMPLCIPCPRVQVSHVL